MICYLIHNSPFRKEFDAERAKEAELVENSRSQMGSNRRNGANSEPR